MIEGPEGTLPVPLFEQAHIRIAQDHLDAFGTARLVGHQFLHRPPKRLIPKLVLGIVLDGAVEAVEIGSYGNDKGTILDEVLVNELLLWKRAGVVVTIH